MSEKSALVYVHFWRFKQTDRCSPVHRSVHLNLKNTQIKKILSLISKNSVWDLSNLGISVHFCECSPVHRHHRQDLTLLIPEQISDPKADQPGLSIGEYVTEPNNYLGSCSS